MHALRFFARYSATLRSSAAAGFLVLCAGVFAQPVPRNGRLNELPVQRFVFTGVASLFLQEGRLNILFLDPSFDGSGVPLARPAGFPDALLDRTVIALDSWLAYERLGSDVVRNFKLTGPEYAVLGRVYREVSVDEPNADYIGGRPVNISTRARVGAGAEAAIAGFVVEDSSALLLIRGIGPGLTTFGVEGVLPNPFLTVFTGSLPLRFNNDWHTHPDAPRMEALARAIGAFPLVAGAGDAAILEEFAPGAYTVQLSDFAGGTGIGLIEVYVIRGEIAARAPATP